MNVNRLVDDFVRRVNSGPREFELAEEIPPQLRDGPEDDGCFRWLIKGAENSERIRALEARAGFAFPPSYRELVCRYSFPAFEFGPVMLFSNTGTDLPWELEKRVFLDPHMSPALLAAGYVQIGNPQFYNYDPVCVEVGTPRREGRLVRFDHEAILQFGELHVIQDVAPSFAWLLEEFVRGPAA